MTAQAVTPERDPGRWGVLYSAIVASLAAVLDGAMMGLIAPAVAKDLGADAATISLLSAMSMLMLAAFMLGGGTLGDIYGRKRFLSYGLIGMTITSILAILAPSANLLLPVRALAGIVAALVAPLALAIIFITFDKEERPRALGVYGAAIGVAGGLGTIAIALVNQLFGWRATFGLTILLAVTAFLMVRRFVKESKVGGSKRVDWIGILLTAVGLFGVVYGINQAGAGLTSPEMLVPLGIGVVVLVVLVLHSKRTKDPALQLSLFQDMVFSVGVLLVLLMGFASMGAFFQLSTYLQALPGVSPLEAAVTLLPYTISLFVFAILAGRWVGKFSNQLLITGGLVLMMLGLGVMGLWLSPTAGFWVYLLPLAFLGGGYSIANTPRVNLVLASASRELAGAASAINNASYQLGNAFGIAIMGVLFRSFAIKAYSSDLTALGLETAQIERSVEVLSAWLKTNAGDVGDQFGITAQQLQSLISHYQNAYTMGVMQVLWIGAIVAALCAVMAWLTFKKKAEAGKP